MFDVGEKIVVFHEKIQNPFKTIITSFSQNEIAIKIGYLKVFEKFNFGDEVLINNYKDMFIERLKCEVIEKDTSKLIILLKVVDKIVKKDFREVERLFVSFPAKIINYIGKKNYNITIKDMTPKGVKFLSSKKIPQNKKNFLMMDIGDDEIQIGVDKMWVKRKKDAYEYGVIFENDIKNDKLIYEDFVNSIYEEQDKAFEELKI